MDWTTIIVTVLTVLISNGGLVTLVTLKEKKTAAFLDNVTKLIDQWQEIAEERKQRVKELKDDLESKEKKIEEVIRDRSGVRDDLDHTRTSEAVAKILRCDNTSCLDRKPPFGSNDKLISNE